MELRVVWVALWIIFIIVCATNLRRDLTCKDCQYHIDLAIRAAWTQFYQLFQSVVNLNLF